MGVLISELFSDSDERSFRFGKHTVNLKCKVDQMTPAVMKNLFYLQSLERRQKDMQRNPQVMIDALAAVSTMVADLLVEWDVLQEDGSMYPIAKDELMKLPLQFLMAALTAIRGGAEGEDDQGEASPGETTSSNLSATSSRQAKPADAPTGIPTSRQGIVSIARRGSSSRDSRRTKAAGQRRRLSR